jgi:hypothetical protein
MDILSDVLPIILYLAGIVLLVILIIIGIRVIKIMDNVDGIVKDVDYKVKSLNGLFHIVDVTADKLAVINDKLVEGVSNFILKLFKRKYNNTKEEENEDE